MSISKGGAGPQATRATAWGVGKKLSVYFLDGLGRSPIKPCIWPSPSPSNSSTSTERVSEDSTPTPTPGERRSRPGRRPRPRREDSTPTRRPPPPARQRPAPGASVPAAAAAWRLPDLPPGVPARRPCPARPPQSRRFHPKSLIPSWLLPSCFALYH
jgi:hypothetical protein